MRILFAVRTRVPGEGSSAQGKSGPKVYLKGEADGQQVKIPALTVWSDGGTHYAIQCQTTAMLVGTFRRNGSENLPFTSLRRIGSLLGGEVGNATVPRKASKR